MKLESNLSTLLIEWTFFSPQILLPNKKKKKKIKEKVDMKRRVWRYGNTKEGEGRSGEKGGGGGGALRLRNKSSFAQFVCNLEA